MNTSQVPTSHVRFTRDEFFQLKKDELLTGQSIPWLLKTAYFHRGISAPTLDSETRKAALRELAYIGNNLNQLSKQVNSGLISNVKEEVLEMLHTFRNLRNYLGLDYGDRKDSV